MPFEQNQPFTVKVIGKRKKTQSGLLAVNNLLKLVIQLRGNRPFIPKGLYRFKSFEESQEWTLKMMTRRSSQDHRN
jgi:hypothetical protein